MNYMVGNEVAEIELSNNTLHTISSNNTFYFETHFHN